MRSFKFTRLIVFAVFFALMVFGLPALAQEVPAFGDAVGEPDGKVMAIIALLVPLVCSVASALLPSDGNAMRIIDLLAFNMGYAKNTSQLNANTRADRSPVPSTPA